MYQGNRKPMVTQGEVKFSTADVEPNRIPIFIDPAPSYPSFFNGNHLDPTDYPALVLAFDRGWNDYHIHSQFDVFYHPTPDSCTYIGKTKIIVTDELLGQVESSSKNSSDDIYIIDWIKEEKIYKFSSSFCSLGQTQDFYYKLKHTVRDESKAQSILWALNDVGMFPGLQEKYEKESLWSSLRRNAEAERMLRFAREAVNGEVDHHYEFTYNFIAPYSRDGSAVPVTFKFNSSSKVPSRLYALIGKNGSGKTRLLSSIPRSLNKQTPEHFTGQIPQFGKIIAISNSHYDNFEIPEGRADFNYVYCGLSEIVNGKRQALSTESIFSMILDNCRRADKRVRENLRKGMSQIADESLVKYIFAYCDHEDSTEGEEEVKAKMRYLSSGEVGLLYLFSSILTNIRYDSLILFDEPENHLHPNSIMLIVSLLYDILEQYDSYAIVATHSPIVVNAIRAENVLIVRREGGHCKVRKIGIESLGANLSDLTEYVFGTLGLPLHYKKLIDELIEDGYAIEKIAGLIKSPDLDLSLPVRLFLDMKIINKKGI